MTGQLSTLARLSLVFAWLVSGAVVRAANPALPVIPATVFNVTNYGAIGNGSYVNTTNIQNAINAASQAGGGVVEIPSGTFLCGPITLPSSIDLQLDKGALLEALAYETFPASSNQFIYSKSTHDVAISGSGTIDGQGLAWWSAYTNNNNLSRPLLLQLYSVDRLFIHDVTLQNPAYHHCGIRDNCGNVTISNLTEIAPATSPNTDGLDFVATNSVIRDCNISVGDDNIALGATGPLVDLLITNCAFGNGHGVSVGSSVSDGITNIVVVNCTFNGTVNGIRIKSDQDASGLVTNLLYENLSMTNVELPIVIYSYYNLTGTPTSIPTSEALSTAPEPINATTPRWSGITISNLNITAGVTSKIGGIIWGPTEWPISNLTLVNVTNNAPGTFDLYNVYGAQIVDSRFNFSSGNTLTLCNAGVTASNSVPGAPVITIGGAASANSLSLFNLNASLTSANLFAASPVTIGNGVLSDGGGLTLPAGTVQNFLLGSNNSAIAVAGDLSLGGTVNLSSAPGFAASNYTLFTYTGALAGAPALGTVPTNFEGYTYSLVTNASHAVMVQVSPPSPPSFGNAILTQANGGLILSGTGGVSNGLYTVVATTNPALPLSQWIPLATNTFDSTGGFNFTNAVSSNSPQKFFGVRIP